MSAEKPHLNLVVCGHVDHGKSTSVGRLLVEKGYITEREVEAHKVEAEKYGMRIAEVKYAWVLDKLKEERERGMTIDLAFWKFETDKYFYTIIDAPGHRDFVKNMITGTSQADAGLLIVSAKKGDYEAGIGPGGQTREHVFLMRTLGVNQIVVGITKMDDPTVKFDQERFEEVKNGAQDLLKMVGYDISKIPVIPISGWTGDNLTQKTTNMPWYKGKTLIDSFDETFTVPAKPLDKPLRLPVQDVYTITGVGTVPVGRVETGVLKVDDKVVFMPANKTGEIKSIETHHTLIKKAEPGDNVGFNIRGIGRDDITRGDVCGPADAPPTVVKEFIGQIVIIHHPTAIAQGYTPVLHAHTATVACEFAELLQKLDPRTGQIVEEKPAYLKEGDGAVVRFRPLRPLSVEAYSEFPPMGRFAIRDMGTTIAAGIIKEITEKA
ncbi:MAG: translation elongation factor EF-1 subunit alpha [Candidatus Bathyarchaeota archaeon]|nr:MAG: translation elongation factor EF-1 subunit alpha [Candidatus Bathyarchaeota archaeon]